jgi:protochlorophyllide reductase
MPQWTANDIPDQTGRTVLITGANSGLGLAAAGLLADRGARVLMACRSPERGKEALRTVGGTAELVKLDLADLGSVREAAEDVRARTGDRLDVLMNNAGVMMTPKQRTADGFELQFGTNHLGHAALTWLLMPALRTVPGARVVTLSSMAARPGRVDLADPQFEHRRYQPNTAYSQAKLANLMFALATRPPT